MFTIDIPPAKPVQAFTEFVETQLNAEQKEAVFHDRGPILVIAGAGSGKTRLITSRISHLLLTKNALPTQIVALTFTNKAAQEMKERVIHFTTHQDMTPFIGTFHSYCLLLLKKDSKQLSFEQFSIMDEDDKRALLTKLLKKSPLHKKLTPQAASHLISHYKNQLPGSSVALDFSFQNPSVFEIYKEYENEKKISKCLDFDDLLIETLNLFKKNPEIKARHQERVRHLLVDEYQDTNTIQHALLKEMALDSKGNLGIDSICVVGDEDQSIYSWRGATVENIIDFKKDFKGSRLVKIEQNYRSKQPILSVANNVIQNNTKRNEKKLWSAKTGNDCVRALRCLSGYQEAEIIGRLCKNLFSQKKSSSTAILYRTHYQSRLLEEALLRHSVPYTIIGGIRFYERKEIKDLLAYLRLIINPFDKLAFDRVINCPLRGLGDKFQENILDFWSTQPLLDIHHLSKKIAEAKLFPASKIDALFDFCKIIKKHTPNDSATQAIADIVAHTGYIDYLKKTYEPNEADERHQNIKELLNAAHYFGNQGKGSIKSFLEEVALLQEQIDAQSNSEKNSVTLMTLHAAKGLEFDTVIITGMEENILPSARSLDTQDKLEEERRLLYVGITRARNRLLFTYTRYRQSFGQMDDQIPSRFLEEIPHQFCTFEQADRWQYYEVDNYLSKWVGGTAQGPELFLYNPNPVKQSPTSTPLSAKKPTLVKNSFKAREPEIKKTETRSNNPIPLNSPFKKHQSVQHETFGLGIIKDVEQKRGKTFAEIQFKDQTRKIEVSFLKII